MRVIRDLVYGGWTTDERRRGVAYIAACLVNGQAGSAVFDYASRRYYQFSGDVSAARVNVFDYARGCHLSGSPPSLYDYGDRAYVEVQQEGRRVKGFDYGSRAYYEATVNGRSVSVYDYGARGYFNYSV